MSEEKTVTPDATPAPVVTPAENNAAPVVTAPESAPDTTATPTGTPKQESKEDRLTEKDYLPLGYPPGLKKRLFEQQDKIRKMEAEIAKGNIHPVANPPKPESAPATESNLLDDPDKWANTVEGRITANAEKSILARLEQETTRKRIAAEAEKAQEFILSHKEFESEESMGEIQSIIASPEVQALCSVNPMKGAEYGVYLWQKAKGLDPESVKKANANAAKSESINPSGTPTGGKKVWTPAQVEAYLKDYMAPDFNKKKAEIALADKEGRIKV